MPRMLYHCTFGTAPGPAGIGRVAMYEVADMAGDRVEAGRGEQVFDTVAEALKDAMALGRSAVERLESGTITP